jgi:hypothetical protein
MVPGTAGERAMTPPRPIPLYRLKPEIYEDGAWRKLSECCRAILEGLEARQTPPDEEALAAMAHLFNSLLVPHIRAMH